MFRVFRLRWSTCRATKHLLRVEKRCCEKQCAGLLWARNFGVVSRFSLNSQHVTHPHQANYSIVERADRIARELGANAKRKTWMGKKAYTKCRVHVLLSLRSRRTRDKIDGLKVLTNNSSLACCDLRRSRLRLWSVARRLPSHFVGGRLRHHNVTCDMCIKVMLNWIIWIE